MQQEAELIILPELDRKEKLLWSGKPKQGILFRSYDIFVIPFSLLWGGFMIFAAKDVLSSLKNNTQSGIVIFPALIVFFFALIGLYMIFGRFIVDAKQREKTYYALTDPKSNLQHDQRGTKT